MATSTNTSVPKFFSALPRFHIFTGENRQFQAETEKITNYILGKYPFIDDKNEGVRILL